MQILRFFQTLVGLVKVITNGNVHPIDLETYGRGVQDLIDMMLSVLPEKRPTVKEIMGKSVITPIVYTIYMDAGCDELLCKYFYKLY